MSAFRHRLSLITLLCPVRGCGQPLDRSERRFSCARAHSFDLARSGYLNLLQPQDRRSASPGDSRASAQARRRLYEAGHGAPLLAALLGQLDELELPALPAVLDVGCGEGSLLGGLARGRRLEAHGLDISAPAIELAARRFKGREQGSWVVANADRFLPYASGSFDVELVLSARLNPGELHRVLKPEGWLIVAVPAPDDLVELRAALLGEGTHRDRLERAIAVLSPAFELEARAVARHGAMLDGAGVRDVLAATYRGGRPSRRARGEAIEGLQVTMSHEVARFRPRPMPRAFGSGVFAL